MASPPVPDGGRRGRIAQMRGAGKHRWARRRDDDPVSRDRALGVNSVAVRLERRLFVFPGRISYGLYVCKFPFTASSISASAAMNLIGPGRRRAFRLSSSSRAWRHRKILRPADSAKVDGGDLRREPARAYV